MIQMGIQSPEILAPAGSMEVLKAAVEAGCDAVYVGGSQFGARAFAGNFDSEELVEAIAYAHQRGVCIYLTVNTLLKQKEIDRELVRYLLPFYEAGLDAVIVQELGVFKKIRNYFPELPIHVSTQAGIMSEYGASLMKKLGASRVVPARELSLHEIEKITSIAGLEVECFVHGALCYSYSGHCQLSSCVGSRSGNRGRCAQPCRLPYKILNQPNRLSQENYVLSPKDMCAISILPELIMAGIDSFKIEGRMKKAEYVSVVTSLYRKYRDIAREVLCQVMNKWKLIHVNCIKEFDADEAKAFWREVYGAYKVDDTDYMLLMQMYNRGGFTEGYYHQKNGKDMMTMNRPNHHGVYVGKVEGIGKGNISFITQKDIFSQDVLEIRVKDDRIELTSPITVQKGERITLNASQIRKIKPGQPIYRMKSPYWIAAVNQEIKEQNADILLDARLVLKPGEPLVLQLSEAWENRRYNVECKGEVVQEALKTPVSQQQVTKALCQTGGTGYIVNSLDLDMEGNCFVSMKAIKDVRREAIQLLKDNKQQQFCRDASLVKNRILAQTDKIIKDIQSSDVPQNIEYKPKYAVSVRTLEQWESIIEYDEVDAIYADAVLLRNSLFRKQFSAYHKDREVYLILPRMFRDELAKRFQKDSIIMQFAGFVVGSLDAFQFALQYADEHKKEYELVLDHSLYVFNRQAAKAYVQIIKEAPYGKLRWMNAPYEATLEEIVQSDIQPLQLQVYGCRTVMTSAQCLVQNSKGCYSKMQLNRIQDRKGKNYIVYNNCEFCNNQLIEEEPVSMHGMAKEVLRVMPASVRFDFTKEDKDQMKAVLEAFWMEYEKDVLTGSVCSNTGHYFRPVD